jgi:cytidine deaminase
MHPMCCAACRQSISELYATVDECVGDSPRGPLKQLGNPH